ncbi:1030_t:CDS:1, partial [Scutellospora calospora]
MFSTNKLKDLEENRIVFYDKEQLNPSQKNYSKKRSRASFIACDKCRSMKKKCDGDYTSKKSCSSCTGRQEECNYSDTNKKRIVEVYDFQRFINRLELVSDEIRKLTDELKNIYESSKSQDDLKSSGNGYDFDSDVYVESISSNDNFEREQSEERTIRKPKPKTSGTKKRSKESKNEDSSSTKQKKDTKGNGNFSKLYLSPKGYVTHQFDLNEINETSLQFGNAQYQPPPPVNNSELLLTDHN